MRNFGLLSLSVLIALAGCGSGGFSQRRAEGSGDSVFRYPIVTNPTTLDPGMVQDGDTIDVIHQVFEGLVTWNEKSEIEPSLAERWDIEDEGRTYVFHLRPGVKFHNGRELTAEDFKWSLERNVGPDFPSETTELYLSDIVGFKEKLAGQAEEISGVRVVDGRTLKITIDKPRPYFLGKLTYPVASVMAKEAVPEGKQINAVSQMVGTGPFKAARFEPNLIVELEAFADYHGGAPKVAKIQRPIIMDPQTRLNKYRQGEVDLVQLERADIAFVQQDEQLKSHLQFFDRPSTYFVSMSQVSYPPFRDVRVRRAIAMAIDRDEIVDETLGGINKKAVGLVPPGVPGHRADLAPLPYDPVAAKRLLADAGYPEGRGLPPLRLTFREKRTDIRSVAEKVAAQLKRNLGINVENQTMEWGAFLDKTNRGEIPFFHARWMADYLDPENFLSLLIASYGAENDIGYVNRELDRLCGQADTLMDADQRMPLYAKAEEILVQDVPLIPIYYQRDAELIHPKVKGIRNSLFGHLPHHTVSLEK